jgi:hypothetical protein
LSIVAKTSCRPGTMNLPAASITSASRGIVVARRVPTAVMRPSWTMTTLSRMSAVPLPKADTSTTVPPTNTMECARFS